jgi:hypothetical protein
MSSEVILHHNLTGGQGRSQQRLHVSLEHSGGGRSFRGHRSFHPFLVKPRKQRGVLALNAWCELLERELSGRCPRIRVGLPIPIPEGKGTDSSWSMWTPSSPYSTSWSTTSASPVRKRNSTPDQMRP